MSKPVKELVRQELIRRFEGVTSLAVVGFTGLDAVTTNRIRGRLRQKAIRLTVVKNSLAKQAFRQIGLEKAAGLLDGPCGVAYGADPEMVGVVTVVRELTEIGRASPALTVKAALLEGQVFVGPEQVTALSRYPTREEALADVAACLMGPAGSLAACLVGPGGQVAALLKAIEERYGEADDQAAA